MLTPGKLEKKLDFKLILGWNKFRGKVMYLEQIEIQTKQV